MKATLFFLFALSTPALASPFPASPEADSVHGTYHGTQPDGRGCHLKILKTGGKTQIEFTDSMSSRTLRNVDKELNAQLARRSPELVFKHSRQSLGDVTIHLVIVRGPGGRPASMHGRVNGWLEAEINCRFR